MSLVARIAVGIALIAAGAAISLALGHQGLSVTVGRVLTIGIGTLVLVSLFVLAMPAHAQMMPGGMSRFVAAIMLFVGVPYAIAMTFAFFIGTAGGEWLAWTIGGHAVFALACIAVRSVRGLWRDFGRVEAILRKKRS